jgi:hypothetical protein
MGRKFGFSFSWKRAVGISGAKNRISRKIGIPLTRQGRQRKVGRAAGCFVATSVYESENAAEVRLLRHFRDEVLLRNCFGRFAINCYYWIGPYLAYLTVRMPFLKRMFRSLLDRLIRFLEVTTFCNSIDKNSRREMAGDGGCEK